MGNMVMKNIQRAIRERTAEMDSEAHVAFLRELAEWAQVQPDMDDYVDDFYQHFDNG